ncbi:unnamed protein product [Rodentolepis nana]|uniref:Uncharacterized protein n=1 Tax=Rodentolepis nana TaxID=102285 RepID=A0A3P7TW63_RODNA|nr:unnamed protein product [Rodentolepis nana]
MPPKNMFVPIKPVPKLDFDDDDNVNPTSIMTPMNDNAAEITRSEDSTNHDCVNVPMSLITPERKENSTIPLIITPWGKMAANRGIQSIRMGRTLRQNH